LFSLYTSPISQIAASHEVTQHQYADDTQLFISLHSNDIQDSVKRLEECLLSLYSWFCHNGLSLNADKSEVILLGTSRRKQSYANFSSINITDSTINLSKSIKLLGVTLDNSLSLDTHVAAVCKSSWYHLRALKHIRNAINKDTAKSIGHALVSSRLDYANAVLYGTSNKNFQKLQRVQNSLAKIVCSRSKHAPLLHSSDFLQELHWLPIKQRVTFKLAVLAYKCRHNLAPQYLSELLSDYQPSRSLRSSGHCLLNVPRVKTQFGARGFRVAIPITWNALTDNIRQAPSFAIFKQHLKSHLYNSAYSH
jgi:hypothetical protein